MTELAALAAKVATLWGDLSEPPRLVVARENAVFDIRFKSGERGALRLHRAGYQTVEGILSELRWMERLADAGFRCPTPMRTLRGELVVAGDGDPAASVIRWIEADPIGAMGVPYAATPETYHIVGGLIGDLHRLTDGLDLSGIKRRSWCQEALLGDAPDWGRFWENPALTPPEQDLLQNARRQAANRLSEMNEPDVGLIHADVLQENILSNEDGLWLIDFDDAGVGYRLYDLGTALIQHIHDDRYDEIADALAEGYSQSRRKDVCTNDLYLFTVLRGLASCGWIMSRAAPNDPRQRAYADRALYLAARFLD